MTAIGYLSGRLSTSSRTLWCVFVYLLPHMHTLGRDANVTILLVEKQDVVDGIEWLRSPLQQNIDMTESYFPYKDSSGVQRLMLEAQHVVRIYEQMVNAHL